MIYDLIYNFLEYHETFVLTEYNEQIYSFKINGKSQTIKLNKKSKHDWLKKYNAFIFMENNRHYTFEYDFHGCILPGIEEIVKAIFDYSKAYNIKKIVFITGNGLVVRPKLMALCRRSGKMINVINKGSFEVS